MDAGCINHGDNDLQFDNSTEESLAYRLACGVRNVKNSGDFTDRCLLSFPFATLNLIPTPHGKWKFRKFLFNRNSPCQTLSNASSE
jgi:hypothetical protein